MSADMKYPSYLYKNSIAKNKPKVYAQGAVSLLSTKQRDFSKGIEILLDKDIKRVAIANPKTAPYGKASKEALKAKNIYSKISDKFIYAESISQSISYTLKATDIGLVAKSSLYSPKLKRYKKDINYIDIPTSLYTPINQGIVILKDNNITREFYEFVLSNKTKEILSKYGYIVK
jgi:molybdate transport system substrate-binding protein